MVNSISATRTVLAAAAVLAVILLITPRATAQTPGSITQPAYSQTGVAFVVFSGGSLAELRAAAVGNGAGGVWVQGTDGTFLLLTIDGPAFLNTRFEGRYAAGFAGVTPVNRNVSGRATGVIGRLRDHFPELVLSFRSAPVLVIDFRDTPVVCDLEDRGLTTGA